MRRQGRHCAPRDSGQEAVGQALLIAGVAAGALSASQLSQIVVEGCQRLIIALG